MGNLAFLWILDLLYDLAFLGLLLRVQYLLGCLMDFLKDFLRSLLDNLNLVLVIHLFLHLIHVLLKIIYKVLKIIFHVFFNLQILNIKPFIDIAVFFVEFFNWIFERRRASGDGFGGAYFWKLLFLLLKMLDFFHKVLVFSFEGKFVDLLVQETKEILV